MLEIHGLSVGAFRAREIYPYRKEDPHSESGNLKTAQSESKGVSMTTLTMTPHAIEEAFKDAIAAAGLTPPTDILADGKIHRWPVSTKCDDKTGWYVLHLDDLPAGSFGDWRNGVDETWCAKSSQTMSTEERKAHRQRMEAIRRQREEDEKRRHAKAAKWAQQIWNAAKPASNSHPYLQRKGVPAHKLRLYRGPLAIAGQPVDRALIVPLHLPEGGVCSLEFIPTEGQKLLLPGGRKRGAAYPIGTIDTTQTIICITEGWATGMSVWLATNYGVIIAFDAGNLEPVAKNLRAKYPTVKLVICADNDFHADGKPNTGLLAAEKAAQAVNGVLAVPPVLDNSKTDWNDVFVTQGLEAVKQGIEAAISPPKPTKEQPMDSSESTETTPPAETPLETKPTSETISFDVEALPAVLRDYAEGLAKSLPIAVDLPAIAAMVVAGAAIGGARFIRLKAGWVEHAGLYAALVAPTGTLKSPMLEKIVAPLALLQSELATEYKDKLRKYEEKELPKYRAALKLFEAGELPEPPTKPQTPVQTRTFTVDTTVERLGGLLDENPKGLLIVRDELSAWVRSLDQYRNGHGTDRQFYLSAYSAMSYVVDRQGKPPISIDRLFLSVVGNIPPDVLPELSHDASREDGFVHRIIFAFPPSVSVRWNEYTVSLEVEQKYQDLIRNLFKLRDGEVNTLSLTPQAQTFFRQWHDEHCIEMEAPTLSPELRGFYAKYKGICARLALIHALAENPNAIEIPLKSVAAACDLTDYFKTQVGKVLPLLPRQRLSQEERCEREILRNLADGKILTDRELQRNGNSPAVVFREVLKSLKALGRIEQASKPGGKGKRPANRLANEEEKL